MCPELVAHTGYSHLNNSNLDLKKVYSRLRKYSLQEAVNALSRIDFMLGYNQSSLPDVQTKLLLNKFGCATIMKQYIDYLRKNVPQHRFSYVIFHERQIYNAMKFCLRYCAQKDTQKTKPSWRALVEALLITNDHIEELSTNHVAKKKLIRHMIRNALFSRYDAPTNVISRWYSLIFDSYNYVNRADPHFIDFKQVFSNRYKVKPEQFISFCIALFTLWFQLKEANIDKGQVCLEAKELKRVGKFKYNLFNKCLSISSATPSWFRAEIKRIGRFSSYNFLPLRRKPILDINGNLHCVSKKFFVEKFTSGIYHMMIDSFKHSKDVDKFFITFGQVYEKYLTRILNREFNKSKIAKRFYKAKSYNKKKTIESCDGIIDYCDWLLVLEFKAKLFSHEYLATGHEKSFKKKFEEIVFRSARQLNATINDFQKGILVFRNIKKTRIRKFFPVIVSLQSIPMFKALRDYIDKELARRKYLQESNVSSLEIIDTFELELMLALIQSQNGRMSLIELIQDKQATFYYSSMSEYLFDKYPRTKMSPDHITKKFESIKKKYSNFWKIK